MVQEAGCAGMALTKRLGIPKAFLTTIVTRLCLDHLKSEGRGGKLMSAHGCPTRSSKPAPP